MGTLGSRGSAPHRSLSQQHGGCQHGGHQHGGRCHGGATPAACRPHGSRLGPGTHSPSPTSARSHRHGRRRHRHHRGLQRGKGRLPWVLSPVGIVFRPSADNPPRAPLCHRCKIPPQNAGPPPSQLGAGQRQVVPNSRYSRKNNSARGKHTFPPFFVSKAKACSSALFSSNLTRFFFQPRVPLNSTAAQGERANTTNDHCK